MDRQVLASNCSLSLGVNRPPLSRGEGATGGRPGRGTRGRSAIARQQMHSGNHSERMDAIPFRPICARTHALPTNPASNLQH